MMVWSLFIIGLMGLFFYSKIGSIIPMVALSTTEIIEPAYIEMKHSYKRYQVGDTEIVANRDVNFEIEKGGAGYYPWCIWCRQVNGS